MGAGPIAGGGSRRSVDVGGGGSKVSGGERRSADVGGGGWEEEDDLGASLR